MIKPEMIPPEAVEAAARADYEMIRGEAIADHGVVAERWYCPWGEASDDAKAYHMDHARTALAAALSAWPEVVRVAQSGGGLSQEPVKDGCLILPLPTEKSDGE